MATPYNLINYVHWSQFLVYVNVLCCVICLCDSVETLHQF